VEGESWAWAWTWWSWVGVCERVSLWARSVFVIGGLASDPMPCVRCVLYRTEDWRLALPTVARRASASQAHMPGVYKRRLSVVWDPRDGAEGLPLASLHPERPS